MKKRINRTLVLISVLAIVLTTVLITAVNYSLFYSQVIGDLKDCSTILREAVNEGKGLEQQGKGMADLEIRVTLVDFQGQVLYDNEVSSNTLENHIDRPEIKEAFEKGEGECVRKSETLARNTFYYAVKTQDGNVLRLSKDAGSIYSIFGSAIPTILWITALLILLSLAISHFLTHKLIAPIEKLAENMDKGVNAAEYEELAPFVDMIQEQHKDIMKNAQMRQEFTANVSHELKTPLTSISGYAELIETGMASEEDVVRFAHGIRSSAQRLLTLINDIIRLSELDDSSEMDAPFEDLNLYELAETCVEMLQMSAEKHKVHITLSGYECHIKGNHQMIEELLYNLCDNAIRYNNEGGNVEVQVFRETSGERRTVLQVKDTGIGISKEHQERIFERFYRVDKSRSKSTGGTGLGLAIVKHIVAKHGAKMELKSELGKGTEIRVLF